MKRQSYIKLKWRSLPKYVIWKLNRKICNPHNPHNPHDHLIPKTVDDPNKLNTWDYPNNHHDIITIINSNYPEDSNHPNHPHNPHKPNNPNNPNKPNDSNNPNNTHNPNNPDKPNNSNNPNNTHNPNNPNNPNNSDNPNNPNKYDT